MEEKHKQLALRYLTVRMRSEFEMRQYLEKKQVAAEEIDEIVAYLYSYHYLDDAQFAESFVRDKLRFNPCGRLKLTFALRDKGIVNMTSVGKKGKNTNKRCAIFMEKATALDFFQNSSVIDSPPGRLKNLDTSRFSA